MAQATADLGCQRCGWKPRGDLWPTLGELGCDWVEAYCILGEGDSYGKPFTLYEDQQRFIYKWLEYCPGCGQWHYSEATWGAATGSGKTQFIAALGALEFAGPPEIAPRSPNVVVAASTYDQANLLFSQASVIFGGRDEMVKDAPLCGLFEVYENRITRHDGAPAQMIRVAAIAGANEGGLPSLFLADEVHAWGDLGTPKARLHAVIGKSCMKRSLKCLVDGQEVDRGRGRNINLSTAGFDMDHALLGAMYKRGQRALRDPSTAPRLLFHWREARDGLDYKRPEDRAIACRDASGAADVLWSVADRVAEWNKPEFENVEWLRYYANRWVDVAEESWLKDHPAAWAACQGEWRIEGDEATVLAVDMALRHDSVAVFEGTRLHDGRIACQWRIWSPDDRKIDHLAVFDYIRERAGELGSRYQGLVYDPRFFELPARLLEEEGLLVIEFSQAPAQMAPACGTTFGLIINGGLVHDGDSEVARQVKAAVKRQQERGFTLSKGKSRIHIDAAVAMCMGVDALARLEEKPDPMKLFW